MNEVLLEHAPQQPLSYAVIVSKLVDAALQTKAALSIPSVGEYNDALWTASSDVYRAMSTTSRLVIMTLQPFCLLLLIAGRLVSNALVKLAGPVAYTAAKQLQIYLQKLIHWQLHLEPRHVGMELVAVGSFVLVWYLRKWLMRQTYTRRVKTWASRRRLAASRKYEQSRLKLVQIYTRAVHRISRVSSICGVLIPHVLFWILCLFLHQLFPSIMVYLATQTMLTTCLSKLLPLVCSVLLAHDVQMYSKSMARSSDGVDGDTKNTTAASGKRKDSTEIQTPARRRSGLSMFARTHPLSSQSGRRKSSTGTSTPSAATDEWSLDDRLHFWICYWMVHASVSLAILALQTVPIFGWQLVKLAKRYSTPLQTLELLCYVWLYVMPYLLVVQRQHGDLDGRPLQLLRRALEPIYIKLVNNVSSVVSPATWNKYIVTPTTPILHVLATVRILSPQTRDWLLLALQQGQQLVLPCVWLLLPLPGCSVLAVLYVQWVLPLAKSVSACRESAARRGVVAETRQIKRPSTTAAANKKAALNMPLDPVDQTIVAAADHEWSMLVTLEYWIINTLLTMLLNVLASLLWWIPLINIFLFVVWWSLTLKVVVTKVYGVLQRDLTLLGILASHNHDDDGDDKDAKVPVLYRAVCWILARLPSAAERKDDAAAADDDDDDDDDDGQEDIGQEDDEDDGQEDADNEPTSEQQQQQQHDLVDDNDNDDNDDESNDEPVNEDSEDEPVVYTGSYSRTSTVETATAPSPVRRSLRNLAKK